MSIVQKLVIKLPNTSTMFSQQVEITLLKYLRTSFSGRHIITFNVILTITNAISKNLSSSCTKRLPIITYIHPLNKWMCTEIRLPKIFTALYLQSNLVTSTIKGILDIRFYKGVEEFFQSLIIWYTYLRTNKNGLQFKLNFWFMDL